MRSAPTRCFSPARIALVRSCLTSSRIVILDSGYAEQARLLCRFIAFARLRRLTGRHAGRRRGRAIGRMGGDERIHIPRGTRSVPADGERLRPAGAEVFDAHTHLGLDEDGRSLDLETLLSQLDAANARRACVFPLHDPERKPSYSLPNDRVLAVGRRKRGTPDPVLPARSRRSAGRRGRALHRQGRPRHQAAPTRAGLCLRQPRDGGDLQAWQAKRACRS